MPVKQDELYRDAWERFERAVDVVANSPPQHRIKQPLTSYLIKEFASTFAENVSPWLRNVPASPKGVPDCT